VRGLHIGGELMKLGSLFDGIGAFPLSAMRQGITPVWASEIDKSAIAVTKKHFPNMVHLGDITKINGAEIEPVDIISAGSPCQNLSVAGNREGLAGSESQLFHEFIRIVREMREATNNEYPRYILWENVPGAYSSNGGQDFRAVLQEILQSQIPTPKSGRWATAGMVRGAGYSLAWRTLDAQYFGVPQRRKRIFLVADFRGQSAPEILFECESGAGDFAESRSAWKEVAACAGDGVEVTSRCPKMWCSGGRISNPLLASGAEAFGVGGENKTVHPLRANPSKADKPCSTTYVLQGSMIGRDDKNGPQGDGINEDISFTLNTTDRHAVAYAICSTSSNSRCPKMWCSGGRISNPLLASGAEAFGVGTLTLYENHRRDSRITGPLEVAPTICRKFGTGGNNTPLVVRLCQRHTVRRLTPIECERLMGFPDNWTAGHSDSARYRMLGNSVAVPCAEYIIR